MPARHPLLVALEPVAAALGATLVGRSRVRGDDIPLEWEGEVVGGLRLPDAAAGLTALIAQVEAEVGGPLAGLSREDKQRAVALLDERGAFAYRRSVEDVADALGVSRFTVYNYLNARP
ncbi:helix-turn-helix domain-containing protein [Iamia majanohamensis]|uniref:Helix-turn-helix domain-containing protein n=1 Tax=Iamia majanohamensis TaxID=467976 RepID=A0AAE9YAX7_9ACTN|nr:helix-turn-helix domain-containing protein [Iamia majanohamensis]WCO67664.1 helix-turn-helix domain-containing protein [Iamia majanohamensis]